MTRYTVHYTGRVQGVGFRANTAYIARQFQVAGYVQNLPDGSVRIVAEGASEQLDAFLHAICDRMGSFIGARTLDESEPTGEFGRPTAADTFTVRH